jgi:hypothetical protein
MAPAQAYGIGRSGDDDKENTYHSFAEETADACRGNRRSFNGRTAAVILTT